MKTDPTVELKRSLQIYREGAESLHQALATTLLAVAAVLEIRGLPDERLIETLEREAILPWRQLGRWCTGEKIRQRVAIPDALDLMCCAEMDPIKINSVSCWTAGIALTVIADDFWGEVGSYAYDGPTVSAKECRHHLKMSVENTAKLLPHVIDRLDKEIARCMRENRSVSESAVVDGRPAGTPADWSRAIQLKQLGDLLGVAPREARATAQKLGIAIKSTSEKTHHIDLNTLPINFKNQLAKLLDD